MSTDPPEPFGEDAPPPLNDPPPLKESEDVKPSLKKPARQQSFNEQEVLLLAQAYMRESLDPIRGTSKKADVMWNDIEQTYNRLRQEHDARKLARLSVDEAHTPLPERKKGSLRSQWSKSIQPAVNKFVGIHHRYNIKSGETEEAHFDRLFELYEREVSERKLTLPPKFHKYYQAYLWLRIQPKFGSHFEDPENTIESMDSDVEIDPGSDSPFSSSPSPLPSAKKKARPRPARGRDKSKMQRKVDEVAEKAAGNVKDYLKQQSARTDKDEKERWDSLQNAIQEMTKTNKQILQMQIMQDAPETERIEYMRLLREKAMADARKDLSLSVPDRATGARSDNTSDSSNSE